jgi:hypothetical protein
MPFGDFARDGVRAIGRANDDPLGTTQKFPATPFPAVSERPTILPQFPTTPFLDGVPLNLDRCPQGPAFQLILCGSTLAVYFPCVNIQSQ